ncbi:ejaculatory bulb-specific protein 3-like [Neocloeon triangulifer]|uniref:ejaculatory bulb-specific protein 3-like n=1 Tax=Neocloeon triangulifer TaxID=2078957 RepID=UPI00286F1FA6|nr:ejaculatory bulb-specific protein 3-like [Neocloeon triangulifer]
MALRPLGFILAAIAALQQLIFIECCARTNLDRTTRVIKTTTPRVLTSFKFGDALFLRLEALTTTTTTTEAPMKKTTDSSSMYTNRYDHVAIENVLSSPRLMKNFHWCIMGRGPCTSEGAELKKIIPEALKSDCSRCTERQKVQAGKVLLYLLQHRPEWWKELVEKYDPDGRLRKKYEYELDE